MQRGNIAAIVLGLAVSLAGCGNSSGAKDAQDFCLDMCDTLIDCPNCHGPGSDIDGDNTDQIPDDIDGCIDLTKYRGQGILITNFNELESTCIRTCREVGGTIGVVTKDCREAHEELWECNAGGTCDQIEPIGFIFGVGGVLLENFGDCEVEVAIAVEACAHEFPD